MVTGGGKKMNNTEKMMLFLAVGIIIVALSLGYRPYALGVALASFVAWLLYRWQMIAVANLDGLPPRKATNRLIIRSLIRMLILFSLLGLSILGGVPFLFGVMTGLFLQVATYMGQSVYIYFRKGGAA
jgi:hypothetical protein